MGNRSVCLWLVCLALPVGGCSQQRQPIKDGERFAETSVKVTGFVGRSSNGQLGLIDLRDVSVDSDTLVKRMRAYDRLRTRHIVRLEVERPPDVDFQALLGPRANDPRPAEARVINSTVMLYLIYGWVYVYDKGGEICVKTGWLTGCAKGSKLFVQLRDNAPKPAHRFFFVEGSRAWVIHGGNTQTDLTEARSHIDVLEDGSVDGPIREADLDRNNPDHLEIIETWEFIDDLIASGA